MSRTIKSSAYGTYEISNWYRDHGFERWTLTDGQTLRVIFPLERPPEARPFLTTTAFTVQETDVAGNQHVVDKDLKTKDGDGRTERIHLIQASLVAKRETLEWNPETSRLRKATTIAEKVAEAGEDPEDLHPECSCGHCLIAVCCFENMRYAGRSPCCDPDCDLDESSPAGDR